MKSFLIIVLLFGASLAQAQTPSGEGLRLVEAVQVTLARDLVIQQQAARIQGQEGVWLAARGAFETHLATTVTHGRDRAPLTSLQRAQYDGFTETITDATAYQLSLQRQFRNGLVVRPSLTVSRSSLDVGGDFSTIAQPEFVSNNLARFEVLVNQPLLKGRGGAVVAAGERAAGLRMEAAHHQRDHVAAGQMLVTILAYWQYVAASHRLAIIDTSETRARRLFDETERLVAADRRPRADLDQLRADLADKASTRILAEQAVFEARQYLGLAMGLTQAEARRLPPPADDFSTLSTAFDITALDVPELLVHTMNRRADLVAQHRARDAARLLQQAAARDKQHRLDLSVAVGYTGLEDGGQFEQFFTPLATNIGGLNFSAALRYDLPFNNRLARGTYTQAEANYTAEVLGEENLRRQIAFEVDLARQDLAASTAALGQIGEAVRHHRQALENERAKFQQGFSTLFNVMLFQDRLTLAETTWMTAQARVASALARLRYETGTLPAADALTLHALTTIPALR
jgi:outer membrane protein TolC